jgi:hypothetical protein
MSEEPREDLRCECGTQLVDLVDPPDIEVGERRFPFRRTTDHVVCPACRLSYRVVDLADGPPAG